MTPGIDRMALVNGVVIILVLGIPLGLFAAWSGNHDNPQAALIANVAVLIVFVFGAAVAAWAQRRGTPLAHGLVTAIAAQLLISVLSVIVSLAKSNVVNWLGHLTLITLAAGCGIIGGFVGGRLRGRGVVPSTEHRPVPRADDR